MPARRAYGILAMPLGVLIVCCFVSAPAKAGVIFLTEIASDADSGLQTAQDRLPENDVPTPTRLPERLIVLDSGTTTSGATNGGSLSSATPNTALFSTACEMPSAKQISSLHGESSLFLRLPPVFELLKPPKY